MTAPGPVGGDRIRLTLYSDAAYFGGAEQYLWLLARHLDPQRHSVNAVVSEDPGARVLEERLQALGVEVHRFPHPGFGWFRLLPDMVRLFRRLGGEVLHMNLPSAYDAGVSSIAWAARQAGYRRVVSTEHLPMVQRRYKRFPVKLFFSQWVDRIIAIAESNRELLVRRHGMDPLKVCSIPNGVDEAPRLSREEREGLRRGWGVEGEGVVLGIVARLTRRKGHHRLFQALDQLGWTAGCSTPKTGGSRSAGPGGGARSVAAAASPKFRLVVIGEGEEEARLREQSRRLGLEERVVWLGQRADAATLVQAFDLFVLPSSMETMPLTVLEAMAAEVPVVATAIYGVPELVSHGETGLLVPPGDPVSLSAALRRLLGDPELRRRMGRAARSRWEAEFTARRMAERTAATYMSRGEQAAAVLDRQTERGRENRKSRTVVHPRPDGAAEADELRAEGLDSELLGSRT